MDRQEPAPTPRRPRRPPELRISPTTPVRPPRRRRRADASCTRSQAGVDGPACGGCNRPAPRAGGRSSRRPRVRPHALASVSRCIRPKRYAGPAAIRTKNRRRSFSPDRRLQTDAPQPRIRALDAAADRVVAGRSPPPRSGGRGGTPSASGGRLGTPHKPRTESVRGGTGPASALFNSAHSGAPHDAPTESSARGDRLETRTPTGTAARGRRS